METRETGDIDPAGFATRTEYAIGFMVQAYFWANKAQYESAKKVATLNIVHHLYGDTLAKLDAISHALFNDDIEGALLLLSDIRKELVG